MMAEQENCSWRLPTVVREARDSEAWSVPGTMWKRPIGIGRSKADGGCVNCVVKQIVSSPIHENVVHVCSLESWCKRPVYDEVVFSHSDR